MRATFNTLFVLIIAIPVILLLPIPIDKKVSFGAMGCGLFLYIGYSFFYILNNQRLERKRLKSINLSACNITSDESTEVVKILNRTISETKGGFAKDQLPSIKAIVDPLLQDEIQTIELRDELLEQELLQSSMPMKDGIFSLMIVFMTFSFMHSIMKGSWLTATIGFYFLVFCVLPNISFLRERLPIIRNDYHSLLVGLGWVNSVKRKHKWTVADSIILLRLKTSKPLGTLYVRLLGPTKDFNFTFESVRDPEFIRLWQRWMHPNPRLELMDQDT